MADELDIPEVPSLTGHNESDPELDEQINTLAESELDPVNTEVVNDPRETTQGEKSPDPDGTIQTQNEPDGEKSPDGETTGDQIFEEGASDEDKIKAISEKYGGDAEAVAKAYLGIQRQSTQQGLENSDLKNIIASEFDKRLPGETGDTKSEASETSGDEDLGSLFITDPSKALELVRNEARTAAKEEFSNVSNKNMMQEAETHTQNLLINRAKMHLADAAEKLQDKDGVARYKNPDLKSLTEPEWEAAMTKLKPEADLVRRFKVDEKTFQYPKNVFEWAETILNKDSNMKIAEQRGTNRVLNQIQDGVPSAVITNAKGARATAVKDGSQITSRDSARRFGRGLTDAELDQLILDSEPE